MKIFLLFYDRARAQRRRLHSITSSLLQYAAIYMYICATRRQNLIYMNWCRKYLRAWLIQIGLKNVCDRYLSACNYISSVCIYSVATWQKSPGPREAINRETKCVPHALLWDDMRRIRNELYLCRSTVDKRYKWPLQRSIFSKFKHSAVEALDLLVRALIYWPYLERYMYGVDRSNSNRMSSICLRTLSPVYP